MSIWSNIAKMAGGAAKGTWGFAKAGGRSLGNTVIHIRSLFGIPFALD